MSFNYFARLPQSIDAIYINRVYGDQSDIGELEYQLFNNALRGYLIIH